MTSATESEVMIQLNERQIYDLEWLEDCYKKVRFPNPKCEDFLTEINKTLSNKIRGEYVKYLYDRQSYRDQVLQTLTLYCGTHI